MLRKIISVACAILFLLHQSQEISLSPRLRVSPDPLVKRASLLPRSWWTWSSQNGYKSGTGYLPSFGPDILPSNAYSDRTNQGSYGDLYAHTSSPAKDDSYSRANITTGYTHGQDSTPKSEILEWLDYHNRFRSQYGAVALKWNPKLVEASKRLINTCVWRHTQNNQYGENMSAGQSSIEEVVTGWVNGHEEKESYYGSSSAPSHFTQVIWASTTEVGCYHGSCQVVSGANLPQSPVSFWACNYNPPGNVIGEFAQNVKAKAGGQPI